MLNREKIKELQFNLRDNIEKRINNYRKFEVKRLSKKIVVFQDGHYSDRGSALSDEYLSEMIDIEFLYKYKLKLIEEEVPETRSENELFWRNYQTVELTKKTYDVFINLYGYYLEGFTLKDNVLYEYGYLTVIFSVKYSDFKEEMFEHIKNLNT